ncbi:MAG: tetratricopeptide repeat protein, partial [Candidatus Fonsibacter lacus]|nr:tetratricopeptide repeat protein [Candidatus Fonsibacter lacus]
LAALKINPKHIGANEYLGELYLQTKRPDEAKKRLEVLKACNCEEYKELKEKIEKYK